MGPRCLLPFTRFRGPGQTKFHDSPKALDTIGQATKMSRHQRTEPPGRMAQPRPPHVPHCSSQQTSPAVFSTPIKRLLHFFSVVLPRRASSSKRQCKCGDRAQAAHSTSSYAINAYIDVEQHCKLNLKTIDAHYQKLRKKRMWM